MPTTEFMPLGMGVDDAKVTDTNFEVMDGEPEGVRALGELIKDDAVKNEKVLGAQEKKAKPSPEK